MSKAKTPSQRLINKGVPLELKQFGSENLFVKELSLESLLEFSGEIITLLEVIPTDKSAKPIAIVTAALKHPTTREVLYDLVATSIGKEPEEVKGMAVVDWLRWSTVFKEANNWEELRDLFMELVPQKVRLAMSDLLKTPQKP